MRYTDLETWGGAVLALRCLVPTMLVALRRGAMGTRSRAAAFGSSAAAVLFTGHAVVADSVADPDGIARADVPVLNWVVGHRSGALTWAMTEASAAGGTAGMTVLAVAAATVLWRRRRPAEAVVTLVAAVGAALLVVGFKNLYGRARPPLALQLVRPTSLSLPSGHAVGSIVVLGVIAAILAVPACTRARRVLVILPVSAAVALIGFSRLYLGVHWLTDVLAGWLLGGAWLALCLAVLAALRHRAAEATADAHSEFCWFGLR